MPHVFLTHISSFLTQKLILFYQNIISIHIKYMHKTKLKVNIL